ncbi:Glycosyltransferase Family 5 protein [Glomus cerebriforme]|uniref:Glycosyltransferase Family 5 protein n=1 Tax=Glomus cerebriforme TaxID=658196 RepID=A0A397T7A5_9GLOM|nr:Glycosyltransferase Family 5 protein [Glomus cerebriforme]
MFYDSEFLKKLKIIEKQIYGPISYLGLDANIPDELPHGTTIYHVSKEFGPATLSSMGQIVTGLAQAQANNGSFDVNVIIPFYSYMRKLHKFQKFAQLELQVRDGHGKWQSVKFLVHRLLWNITNNELLEPRSVQVYVIGSPAGVFPLNLAFTTEDVTKIYSSPYSPYPLSQDWKDIYFCKAVAELITYLNTDIDTPLFALTESRGVDIVHLHGASNALVIEFMKSLYVGGKFKRPQPAIVYTIHDYIEEQLYSNAIVNVQKFIDLRNYTEVKSRYFNGRQMYTSAIAIDQAQIVTFVSKIIAQEMVEVPLDFYAKELIMPSILERAIKGEWIGITSGLDFTIINPFNDTLLRETNSNFPNNIYNFDAALLYAETIENSTQPLIITSKFNAKIHLIREGLLSGEDLNRTIVLFTGNFQYSKGLEFFQEATDLLVSRNAKFIIMGQNGNYPISSLKQLAKYYPDNVIIIDDVEFQTNWENLYKAAADILFVPSKSESSGLTAAEGLLFGCSIVGTEVGGLKEFLVNKTSMSMKGGYNSYLFNLIDEKNVELSINEMKTALNNSINDLIRLNSNLVEKEILIRNLVKDALRLGWDRPDGPLEKYIRVYRMALLKLRKGFDKIETLISI